MVNPAVPPVTTGALLAHWRPDVAGVVVLVAASLYAAGVVVLRRRGDAWPIGRTLALLLGLLSVLVATAGGVGVYARVLFWMYTVQALVLLVGAPLLIAVGRPLELLAAVRGRPARGRIVALLANPLLGPAALPVLTFLLFFTPVLDASLRSSAVGAAVRLVLLAAGLVFALPLIGDAAPRTSLAVALAAFVGFFELLADAVPGIVLRLQSTLLTTFYAGLHRPWGPPPLIDQQDGGSILWIVAEVVDLPFLALIVLQWIRADQREAALIDARLDAAAPGAAEGEAGPVAWDPPAPGQEVPATDRPWWETDARVFGANRAADFRPRR